MMKKRRYRHEATGRKGVVRHVTGPMKPSEYRSDQVPFEMLPVRLDIDGYAVIWDGMISRRTGRRPSDCY